MEETLHVNMSMNEEALRIEQPCTVRLGFDRNGTACVRVTKSDGEVIEIPVFRSIGFEKELVF